MPDSTILPDEAPYSFKQKPEAMQRLINEALTILDNLGIPLMGLTARRRERIALVFLAVGDVHNLGQWFQLKGQGNNRSLRSRDIIRYVNEFLGETISSGSYDDIRRKDLRLLLDAGVVIATNPTAARNDSTRGYAIDDHFALVIRSFQTPAWQEQLDSLLQPQRLADKLARKREIPQTAVQLPEGVIVAFSPGEHNVLQKAIIDQFLPRFGHEAEVLYVGDAAQKLLYVNNSRLRELRFFDLSQGELPDVIAYSSSRNWLFLIEAVYSSGPITPSRRLRLESLTQQCTASIIYITAFPNRATFRKFIAEIAWETEVWIAEEPDHLIHFDGEKFLGPYAKS